MATSLRQIVIAETIYLKIKQHCANRQITLTMFYDEMLESFIKHYDNVKTLTFHASQNKGKKLSLWIHERQIAKIKKMAANANVSDARVIYTALVFYVDRLFQPSSSQTRSTSTL